MNTTINLIAPTNKKEFIQLLDEAICIGKALNDQLDTIGQFLEENASLSVL